MYRTDMDGVADYPLEESVTDDAKLDPQRWFVARGRRVRLPYRTDLMVICVCVCRVLGQPACQRQ